MYHRAMETRVDVSALAGDLRTVIGRLIRRLRAEHGFPLMHGAVLGRLHREGRLSTADLAAAERVRPQSMGQTLSELEAQGLISRSPDPADGRRILIALTATGRDALTEDRARRTGWLSGVISANFTPEEQRLLESALPLLERLADV
jgi:DNA-binding MarR family transcriptional regulator